MYLSTIVITYNRLNLNKYFIDSYYETTPQDKGELIVVDNNSTDGTREFLLKEKRINKLLLLNSNVYMAKAWNLGRQLVDPRAVYIGKFDNDSYFCSGWYDNFCNVSNLTKAGIIIVVEFGVNKPPNAIQLEKNTFMEVPNDYGGSFYVRRNFPVKFTEVNKLTVSSNAQFTQDVRKRGGRVVRLCPPRVTHEKEIYSNDYKYYKETFGDRGILHVLHARMEKEKKEGKIG